MGPGMKKSLITNWTLALIEESAKTTLQEEVSEKNTPLMGVPLAFKSESILPIVSP
jgi:hypothetical protein